MEVEYLTEVPHAHVDRRPRKRAKLGWDACVPAKVGEVLCGQDVGDISSLVSLGTLSNRNCSLHAKGVAQNPSPPWREDDKDGHYMFAIGDNLTSRYKIYSKMGEGTFGQVLECWDRKRKEMVAIKIVRGIKKYRDAAMIEIDMLEKLAKHRNAEELFVQIRNWFDYRNHICIVIMHDLCLIHTDLKPENILVVSPDHVNVSGSKYADSSLRLPKSSAIKVIDLGSTTSYSEDHGYTVSTRHYRAPEVILGLGWSYPCDIWSIGCILVELCSGEALFQTHENLEHLAMMERVLGPIPLHMIKRADRHADKYFRRSRLNWPSGSSTRESVSAVHKLPSLQNLVMKHVDHSAGELINLLKGLLEYDPSERLTAREALRHPFFSKKPYQKVMGEW
ncbi:Serine/threonine-protein kinase AFC2 [Apostasia shenzhenica]|uniref:Serine/threonine-protein kinase AFC2 n=1 Tax=Apostasia shenzhenica TaxID=1088818 RepID=A0A2I0BD19_9ASPA|nr:Serine/threonine-protein kinase AFC2 [Apostasia shenzhenica]